MFPPKTIIRLLTESVSQIEREVRRTDLLATQIAKDQQDVEAQKRAQTLSSVIRWVVRTAIMVVATLMVLGQLGVQVGPVIAAAGVVGLAVGFGAQNLVADVISGFFILLEDQVRVGDVVSLNDKGGLVERITLRMIVLRDLEQGRNGGAERP